MFGIGKTQFRCHPADSENWPIFNDLDAAARLPCGLALATLSVRSYDFVGRYGGEEFLIVLNNCRPDSAMARAEEIRKIICTRPLQTDAGLLGITMSLGVLLSSDWGTPPGG